MTTMSVANENVPVSPLRIDKNLLEPVRPPAPPPWPPAALVAFRFLFAYFFLLHGGALPIVDWTAAHVFHLPPLDRTMTGSGDKAVHWVSTFCAVVLAVAAAAIWSVRSTAHAHPRLHAALRILVRYFLAGTMLTYGFAKVLKSQFPPPGPEQWVEPLGALSPMGLLWTFMGYSTVYTVFTGLGEVSGALLLCFRRTTTLGALVVAAVMVNVAMLNFSYDVPVKLFSTHVLLWSLFLLAPDAGRLANVLVLNRPAEPTAPREPFASRWLERGGVALKCLVIGGFIVASLVSARSDYTQWGDGAPRPLLYGLYEVEELVWNGTVRPPLVTDAGRWRFVAVSRHGFLVPRRMDGEAAGHYKLTLDVVQKTATLSQDWDKSFHATLRYAQPDPAHLVLEGTIKDDRLEVRLRKIDESSVPLLSRGFHWISEHPFNR
jgi:uncharacterized membrane protein YphA (DoxX/SURF4 family)